MPSHDRWKLSAPGWWCEMIYKVTSSLYPRRTMRTWPGWTSVGPVQWKENSTAWWPRLSSKLFEWCWRAKREKRIRERKKEKIMRLEKNYPIKTFVSSLIITLCERWLRGLCRPHSARPGTFWWRAQWRGKSVEPGHLSTCFRMKVRGPTIPTTVENASSPSEDLVHSAMCNHETNQRQYTGK